MTVHDGGEEQKDRPLYRVSVTSQEGVQRDFLSAPICPTETIGSQEVYDSKGRPKGEEVWDFRGLVSGDLTGGRRVSRVSRLTSEMDRLVTGVYKLF